MLLASTRLGLIACRHLAECYYTGSWASAPEIAQRYNMNVRSLMPALRTLTRCGILRSRVGGKEPGFMFVQDPKEYSMLSIIVALEGSKFNFGCCRDIIQGLKCDCSSYSVCTDQQCKLSTLFDIITRNTMQLLGSMSVAEHANISLNIP